MGSEYSRDSECQTRADLYIRIHEISNHIQGLRVFFDSRSGCVLQTLICAIVKHRGQATRIHFLFVPRQVVVVMIPHTTCQLITASTTKLPGEQVGLGSSKPGEARCAQDRSREAIPGGRGVPSGWASRAFSGEGV